MKLKQFILIVAIAIGASNLTIVVIRVLDQIRHGETYQRVEISRATLTYPSGD